MNNYSKAFLALLAVLFVRALVLFWLVLYSGISLGPDEAQYWTWSQDLSFGYYSKPPAIAWQIWLSTFLLGHTELGVRASSMFVGFLLPLALFWLAKSIRLQPATAFWAGVVMALIPLGVLGSFFATTDGGYILFWTLACVGIAKALQEQKPFPALWAGICILFGALYKWPIYSLWPFAITFFWIYGNRQQLWSRVLLGIGISLLGLFPSVWWNWAHDWATFKHVFATVKGGNQPVSHGNFIQFIGSQLALVSPLIFISLIAAYAWMIAKWKTLSVGLRFCGALSIAILLLYIPLSFFEKIQGNWSVQAYPTGIVLLVAFLCEYLAWGRIALLASIALSIILFAFTMSIPFLQEQSLIGRYQIPYKVSPFKHNVGWTNLEEILKSEGYNPKENFLFADKYQMSSLLSFYSEDKKRAYFMNLNGIRRNQFSYWPSMAQQQKGKTGYFVAVENSPHLLALSQEQVEKYTKELSKYFIQVEYLGFFPLFEVYGHVVKGAIIFKGIGYNGELPTEPDLW